jgi:hypothetical protein
MSSGPSQPEASWDIWNLILAVSHGGLSWSSGLECLHVLSGVVSSAVLAFELRQ